VKSKTTWKTIGLIGIPALILIASSVFFISSRKEAPPLATPSAAPTLEQPAATATQTQEEDMTGNLMAWVDDRIAAEKIAALYGITLLLYENHIALYWSDETPETLIQTGKENGWPELSKVNPITKDEAKP
jgi:hypothetical protein